MTTELIIILIFYADDSGMGSVGKERNAKLYPSEVVTIGILFVMKGERFRAFYRWLKRDPDGLFGGLAERMALQRQLRTHQYWADQLLPKPACPMSSTFSQLSYCFRFVNDAPRSKLARRIRTKAAG